MGYAEVELDAPTIGDLGSRYGIVAAPTLLAFSGRGPEPMLERIVKDARAIESREYLIRWIEEEARLAHSGSAGGGGKWFGGLFG